MKTKILAFLALTSALSAPTANAQFGWEYGEYGILVERQASDGMPADFYGSDVDVSGDRALVGARGAGPATGAAYLLERNNGGSSAWGETHKLVPPPSAGAPGFGWAVAIEGATAIVGAPFAVNTDGVTRGAVYLFDAVTGAPTAILEPGGTEISSFGRSVASDGVHIVVGADRSYVNPSGQFVLSEGVALVYDMAGSLLWVLEPSIPGAQLFGLAVDVDAGRAVVGAPGQDRMYAFDLSTGLETHLFTPPPGSSSDELGKSVAIEGDLVLAGAPSAPFAEAHLYRLSTSAHLHSFQNGTGSGFALDVDLEGNYAYVGHSVVTLVPGDARGTVHQYDLDFLERISIFAHHQPTPVATYLGEVLAADGATLITGGESTTGAAGLFQGAVQLLEARELGFGALKGAAVWQEPIPTQVRGGAPGGPALIALTAFDGAPLLLIVAAGAFDADGHLDWTIPQTPTLSGHSFELTAAGLTKSGLLGITNSRSVTFF